MRRPRKPVEDFRTDPYGWMVTFGDLVMLLLTFFVMLLTMKSMDRSALRTMMPSTMMATGPFQYQTTGTVSAPKTVIQVPAEVTSPEMLERILSQVNGTPFTGPDGVAKQLKDLVDISADDRGVVISIGSDDLFDSGKAVLKTDRLPVLDAMGHLLAQVTNPIVIMGHADNAPIRSAAFASNWELSFYRALAVYGYLADIRGLSGDRMAVGGFGDQRPRFSNDTPAGRAKNRRVEFILKQPG
jgi:chemotaxis protein MotB